MPVQSHLIHSFKHAKSVTIGSLSVTPFRKSHDAADPHSFMISGHGVNIGVITDIGYACKQVIHHFRNAMRYSWNPTIVKRCWKMEATRIT
jgi:phosphoribosyl 1,2-cyclic phosphodiesterase